MHSFPGRDKPDLFIVNPQERNSGLKKAGVPFIHAEENTVGTIKFLANCA